MADEIITKSEFARRMGVKPQSIPVAIKCGRITTEPDGRINYTTQARAWVDNRNPSRMEVTSGAVEAAPLHQAKLAQVTYSAKLKQLEYETAIKKLVPRDEVRSAIEKSGRLVRDMIVAIPGRISAEVGAEFAKMLTEKMTGIVPQKKLDEIMAGLDPKDVEMLIYKIWDRETTKALDEISKGPGI